MNLALRLSATEAVVYRKPWGIIAFTVCMAICLAVFATVFGLLGYREFNSSIGITFLLIGLLFGAFSWLMLSDLARKSRGWLRNGGVALATATPSGLVFTIHHNVAPNTYNWTDITEIVLADGLKIVESDETSWTRGQFIVFLAPGAKSPTIFGVIGDHVTRSAEGKPYISTSFQPKSARELETALRRLAPAHVLIRRSPRAIFDHTTKTDSYKAP